MFDYSVTEPKIIERTGTPKKEYGCRSKVFQATFRIIQLIKLSIKKPERYLNKKID